MPTTAFQRFAFWPLLLISHFLAASLLAWHLLAEVDFGYALGYEWLSIDHHIERFGPENRYRNHFETTTPDEHRRLFGAITRGIQHGGEGLAAIRYPLPDGGSERLMREPEIVHLRDVARLVDHYYKAGITAGLLVLALLVYGHRRRPGPPRPGKVMAITAASLLTVAGIIGLVGPVEVFYWLHEYAFPDDHPWFFYYQDSLMTTLMKAPDLFGLIGAFWLALTLLIWAGSGALLWRWFSRAGASP